ncbi:hypothetical protein [Streptomyces sp. BPTC-684]|uniref:hypothetical protein n=1 Tax=Streptomyces sp. BPTC-684 TaxID=3043734 RepID=UPI0024B1A31B|nr:hypothetical protein [Streptomyces sp. BPTC-684]WHM40982.1 hypothetical protein QIY60_31680 [Streptomyces sp. BPTC-684]
MLLAAMLVASKPSAPAGGTGTVSRGRTGVALSGLVFPTLSRTAVSRCSVVAANSRTRSGALWCCAVASAIAALGWVGSKTFASSQSTSRWLRGTRWSWGRPLASGQVRARSGGCAYWTATTLSAYCQRSSAPTPQLGSG